MFELGILTSIAFSFAAMGFAAEDDDLMAKTNALFEPEPTNGEGNKTGGGEGPGKEGPADKQDPPESGKASDKGSEESDKTGEKTGDEAAKSDHKGEAGDKGDDSKEGKPGESASDTGGEENLVEVDGKEYYYHHAEHAEKDGPQTTYASRGDAVEGALAKVSYLKDKAEAIKNLGKSPIIAGIPKVYGDDIEKMEEYLDIDKINEMSDDDLRSFVAEHDRAIKRSDEKISRIQEQQSGEQQQQDITKELQESLTAAQNAAQELNVVEAAKTAQTREDVLKAADQNIEDLVKEDLKEDLEAFNTSKNNEDRLQEIGLAKFNEEIEAKRNDLEQKRQDRVKHYTGQKEKINDYYKAYDKAEEAGPDKKELSPQERAQQRLDAFDEFREDLSDQFSWLENKDATRAFYQFAVARADDYRQLLTVEDFYRAAHAYEEKKKEVYGRRQGKAEEEAHKRQEPPPEPGDQNKFGAREQAADPHVPWAKEVEDLKERTNRL